MKFLSIDLIPETSQSLQLIFDQGHAIGELAQKRYAGGTFIADDYLHLAEALQHTKDFLKSGKKVCYEPAFVYNCVLVRPDILARHGQDWHLIEVKGSTSVKDIYLQDVAVQKHVLEGCGLKISKAFIMHINNEYVRRGSNDPKKIFTLADITEEVSDILGEVKRNIREFLKVVALSKAPVMDIGPHCSDPYSCDFTDYCWRHVPEFSIYNIPRLHAGKIEELKTQGILNIKKVPESFPLSVKQYLCVQCAKTGKPFISKTDIKEFIKTLQYPLYFLDFETINPALPLYDGMRPFQHITFQASLHVQANKKAEPIHYEFLGDAKTDPRKSLAEFLVQNIGPKGSVLAYSAAFEKTRIKELEAFSPKLSKKLAQIQSRLCDLAGPFQKGHYVHPGFMGSYSIKQVLPVLVPGMTYKGLLVANGGDAQAAYLNLLSGKLPPKEHLELITALKTYCGQDTFAMVKILERLNV